MYKQKGTGRPATARRGQSVPRRRPCLRPGCAATKSACRRRCARSRSSTRFRPRPRTTASSCSTALDLRTPRPRRCAASFDKLGWPIALIIDGAEVDASLSHAPRATFPNIDVLPVAGHQRLRHPAAAQAGADPRRRRGAGGALQMSHQRSAPSTTSFSSPVITEKATNGLRAQPGDLPGAAATRPSRRSRKRSRSCSRSRSRASTRCAERQVEALQRPPGLQSDYKKAIVTLEEGQKIDITTGL